MSNKNNQNKFLKWSNGLNIFLILALAFFIYNIVYAAPNPGHDWSGVGDGFFAVTGPATTQKTFTFPNANATVLTSNAVVTLAQGGTGANLTAVLGGVVYSGASALAISSAGTLGQLFQSGGVGGTPAWTTATYPSTASSAGKIFRADGTNWVESTATYPDVASSAGKILRADGTNWSASTATYPDTAGTSGNVLTSDGTNWASTAFPSTTMVPVFPVGLHSTTVANLATNSLTVRNVGMFNVPATITVNKISFSVNAVTTAGTMKTCIYTTDGTKVIDATSGTVTTNANTVTVSPAVLLNPGYYYIAIGCATTCNDTVHTYTGVSTSLMHANIPTSEEGTEGTVTHSSGVCDTSLGAITEAITKTPLARLDN